jgi:hypothetical protein
MKSKSLYYIECTCIKDAKFPNTEFHIGDVLWFNRKAAANEMYVYYSYRDNRHTTTEEMNDIRMNWCMFDSHLPLTRRKECAKKWQIKSAAEHAFMYIDTHVFKPVIKEIKVTYEEEEV